MKVFADYHTHTRFSHGKGSVMDNVRVAARRGLEAVAITDHGPANLFGVGIRSLATFDDMAREIERARQAFPEVKVLMGVEANLIDSDGGLDVPADVLKRLDVVLVGYHLMVRTRTVGEWWRLVGRNHAARWSRRLAERARLHNTKALVEAVRKNRVDVVTHPGLHVSIDTEELARECARVGTALEINARHADFDAELIKTAARQGVNFCIGSDAHTPDEVGDFGRALEVAIGAGVDPLRIINVRV